MQAWMNPLIQNTANEKKMSIEHIYVEWIKFEDVKALVINKNIRFALSTNQRSIKQSLWDKPTESSRIVMAEC